MKKLSYFSLLLLLTVVLSGCSNKDNEQYKTLIQAGDVQTQAVIDFEMSHPSHFESKLDLAEYYLYNDDIEKGWEYLQRAEAVLKNADKKERTQNTIKLYYDCATVQYLNQNYEEALSYIEKVFGIDSTYENINKCYCLKAEILFALERHSEAVEIFDNVWGQQPESLSSSDLQAYMYLLADSGRYEESLVLFQQFLDNGGEWFYGLGSFSSSVYEKAGDYSNSILCAYLDYEFYRANYEINDDAFLTNLKTLETTLREKGELEKAEPALSMVLGLFSDENVPADAVNDTFIGKYVRIQNVIKNKTVTEANFYELLSLEKYLSGFPSYYWTAWQAVKQLDADNLTNWLTILKKVIAMDAEAPYAEKARSEIGSLLGIQITESTDLDLLLF